MVWQTHAIRLHSALIFSRRKNMIASLISNTQVKTRLQESHRKLIWRKTLCCAECAPLSVPSTLNRRWFNAGDLLKLTACIVESKQAGHFRTVCYSRIPNPIVFSYNALQLRITKKTSLTQTPRSPTQRTFSNPALEMNNLSFYYTNNTFSNTEQQIF